MATDKNLLGNQVSTMVDLTPLQASCPLQEPHPIIQDEANEMELGTINPPASRHVAHHHHLIPHDVDDNKVDPEHLPPDDTPVAAPRTTSMTTELLSSMPMETNASIDEVQFGKLPSFRETFVNQISGPKTCYEDNPLTIADDIRINDAPITPPKSPSFDEYSIDCPEDEAMAANSADHHVTNPDPSESTIKKSHKTNLPNEHQHLMKWLSNRIFPKGVDPLEVYLEENYDDIKKRQDLIDNPLQDPKTRENVIQTLRKVMTKISTAPLDTTPEAQEAANILKELKSSSSHHDNLERNPTPKIPMDQDDDWNNPSSTTVYEINDSFNAKEEQSKDQAILQNQSKSATETPKDASKDMEVSPSSPQSRKKYQFPIKKQKQQKLEEPTDAWIHKQLQKQIQQQQSQLHNQRQWVQQLHQLAFQSQAHNTKMAAMTSPPRILIPHCAIDDGLQLRQAPKSTPIEGRNCLESINGDDQPVLTDANGLNALEVRKYYRGVGLDQILDSTERGDDGMKWREKFNFQEKMSDSRESLQKTISEFAVTLGCDESPTNISKTIDDIRNILIDRNIVEDLDNTVYQNMSISVVTKDSKDVQIDSDEFYPDEPKHFQVNGIELDFPTHSIWTPSQQDKQRVLEEKEDRIRTLNHNVTMLNLSRKTNPDGEPLWDAPSEQRYKAAHTDLTELIQKLEKERDELKVQIDQSVRITNLANPVIKIPSEAYTNPDQEIPAMAYQALMSAQRVGDNTQATFSRAWAYFVRIAINNNFCLKNYKQAFHLIFDPQSDLAQALNQIQDLPFEEQVNQMRKLTGENVPTLITKLDEFNAFQKPPNEPWQTTYLKAKNLVRFITDSTCLPDQRQTVYDTKLDHLLFKCLTPEEQSLLSRATARLVAFNGTQLDASQKWDQAIHLFSGQGRSPIMQLNQLETKMPTEVRELSQPNQVMQIPANNKGGQAENPDPYVRQSQIDDYVAAHLNSINRTMLPPKGKDRHPSKIGKNSPFFKKRSPGPDPRQIPNALSQQENKQVQFDLPEPMNMEQSPQRTFIQPPKFDPSKQMNSQNFPDGTFGRRPSRRQQQQQRQNMPQQQQQHNQFQQQQQQQNQFQQQQQLQLEHQKELQNQLKQHQQQLALQQQQLQQQQLFNASAMLPKMQFGSNWQNPGSPPNNFQQNNYRGPPRNGSQFSKNSQKSQGFSKNRSQNPRNPGNYNNNQSQQQSNNPNFSQQISRNQCFNCGGFGHWSKNCRSPSNRPNQSRSGQNNGKKSQRPTQVFRENFTTSDGQPSVLTRTHKPPCTWCSSDVQPHERGQCYKYTEEYIALDKQMREGFMDNLRRNSSQNTQQTFLEQ